MRTACVLALAWAAAATVITEPEHPTDAAPSKEVGYNCYTREMWSAQKAAWCCASKQIGCTTADVPAEKDGGV